VSRLHKSEDIHLIGHWRALSCCFLFDFVNNLICMLLNSVPVNLNVAFVLCNLKNDNTSTHRYSDQFSYFESEIACYPADKAIMAGQLKYVANGGWVIPAIDIFYLQKKERKTKLTIPKQYPGPVVWPPTLCLRRPKFHLAIFCRFCQLRQAWLRKCAL